MSVFIGAASCVVHVAQVILALNVVRAAVDHLVLNWNLEENGEESEEFLYHCGVIFLQCLVAVTGQDPSC